MVNSTQIILATLNNSSDPRIKKCEFPIVIIDEATQTLEPDCLLPLYHKAQMVILIGDEKQLGSKKMKWEELVFPYSKDYAIYIKAQTSFVL